MRSSADHFTRGNHSAWLNFVGSVGFKGLGSSWDESVREQWEFNAIDYTIGVQLEIPIGNRAARAIWKRALLQRMQSIEQYRALVDQISQDVTTAASFKGFKDPR